MDKFRPLSDEEIEKIGTVAVPEQDEGKRRAKAIELAKACESVAGTAAAAYLARRCIELGNLPNGCIGWHRESNAMLAIGRDVTGGISCVQRLFFDRAGDPIVDEGKKRRRTNGILKGSALTILGVGVPLVCEGVEDALSLYLATGRPVYASFGAAGLGDVPVRAGVPIVVVADNDPPGEEAARKAAFRLIERGCTVSVTAPETVKDANELLTASGVEAVRSMIAVAKPFTVNDIIAPPSNGVPDWLPLRPIISPLPAVSPFDADLLPPALRNYVLDVSDRQQAPPDFAAVACLCGLAAIAGNEVRIKPKAHDDWEVVPNLWGGIIGRPSAMKSPAMRAALAPVFAIQDRARLDWETAKKEREIDAAMNDLGAKDAAKAAAKAIKEGDRERARRLLAEHAEGIGENAPCPRLIVNDASVEKLGELLNQNRHGLLLSRDELAGFLARMQSEEHQSERAFYLESFNGDGSFTYDRIGRGTVHIERATISIVGGVQPSRIAPIVKGALTGAIDDGLLQRFQLVVWPDDPKDWSWVDRTPDTLARTAYEAAFEALYIFARNLETPLVLRFKASAQEMFRDWMVELQKEARSGRLPGALESHLLKLPKGVATLALIFELVDGGRESVGPISTGRALDWADHLKSHAFRLYSAGTVAAEAGARLIADRREQLPAKFTARDVHVKGWAGLADREAVSDALGMLTETGHIRGVPQRSGDAGGRPSVLYEWNPKLSDGG
jgi:Protein of unknown function (DUF3987)/Toprim domain